MNIYTPENADMRAVMKHLHAEMITFTDEMPLHIESLRSEVQNHDEQLKQQMSPVVQKEEVFCFIAAHRSESFAWFASNSWRFRQQWESSCQRDRKD